MSMKPHDELPWWSQLLWPWFALPWYEQVEDLDAYLAAFRRALTMRADLAEELADDDQPGAGYLAEAGRLTAARHQAEEIIGHEYDPLTPEDEDDQSTPHGGRPVVVNRDHPSRAEVDAEQRGRTQDSESR